MNDRNGSKAVIRILRHQVFAERRHATIAVAVDALNREAATRPALWVGFWVPFPEIK
jgi:hypothetical protein